MELEAVPRAVGFEPSSAAPPASSSSAHGADNSRHRPPSLAHGAENLEDVPPKNAPPRGTPQGARPLHATERLEHRGFCARVVFGAQIVEYENGVDYAARLSKAAYHHGYTAIPLGNAPWSVRKRWANGVLKGARGEARRRDTAKGRGAKMHDKTREPREGRITHTHKEPRR